MKRREFLGVGVAISCAISQPRILMALDQDNRYRKEIGIQLYTLRNQINKDVEGTLKAVADAGYKQVEPYGFPDAQPMIKAAKDNGLQVNSSHFNWDSVVNPNDKGVMPFKQVLDAANKAGLKHLVVPYLADRNRKTLDDYRVLCERCNQGAEEAKKAGIQLAYHNHAFNLSQRVVRQATTSVEEFSPDMIRSRRLLDQSGGQGSVELLKSSKDVSQLHLKDLDKSVRHLSWWHPGRSVQGTWQWGDRWNHHRDCR